MMIAYLHSIKLAHLDLKPGNILLKSPNYDVKICDFGFTMPFSCDIPTYVNELVSPA